MWKLLRCEGCGSHIDPLIKGISFCSECYYEYVEPYRIE